MAEKSSGTDSGPEEIRTGLIFPEERSERRTRIRSVIRTMSCKETELPGFSQSDMISDSKDRALTREIPVKLSASDLQTGFAGSDIKASRRSPDVRSSGSRFDWEGGYS